MASETIEQDETILDDLLDATRKTDWKTLVKLYVDPGRSQARTAILTNFDETVLHWVISCYRPDHAYSIQLSDIKKMIDSIPPNEFSNTLWSTNDEGNTVLHLAAAVGCGDLCKAIASKDVSLIKARNKKNETPLFVAAHYGKLDAARCLHESYMHDGTDQQPDYSLCRRGDGNTILHLAIVREHFGYLDPELASWIMRNYGKLANSVNEVGERPLHVLTRKIDVLNGSSLGIFNRIISYCVFAEDSKKQKPTHGAKEGIAYPENYETCGNIVRYLCYPIINTVRVYFGKLTKNRADEEMQQGIPTESRDKHQSYPPNYTTCISLFRAGRKVIATILVIILGIVGFTRIRKIHRKKEKLRKYDIAVRFIDELLAIESQYIYKNNGKEPLELFNCRLDIEVDLDQEPQIDTMPGANCACLLDEDQGAYDKQKTNESNRPVQTDTPFLLAARLGVGEMVEKILKAIPISIQDLDSTGKNVVMLAAHNGCEDVFDCLLRLQLPEYVFYQEDHDGNGILHLAARFMDAISFFSDPYSAMLWEMRWYQHVKLRLPRLSYAYTNHIGDTAWEVFRGTHQDVLRNGNVRVEQIAQSCSLVAALIATVTFATSATVPGGLNQGSGRPVMEDQTSFTVFSISSLLAFCLSMIALVSFLHVIVSSFAERKFNHAVPRKFCVGLTALVVSIAALLVSFFAGYNLLLRQDLRTVIVAIYSIVCGPLVLYALAHLQHFITLLRSAFR